MKKTRYIAVVLLTLLISFIFVPVAFAHPLGNFTINQYAGLQISREIVLLDYVLDMAEIPAFQEISAFDANRNGQAESTGAAGYHAEKCLSLEQDFSLLLNNRSLDLTLASSSVEFPAGVSGLPTLRLTCEFEAPIELTNNNLRLSFVNNAFPDRLGWKEIVITPNGVSLQGDYSTTSLSNRLMTYPEDLLTSPLEQRQVNFEITSNSLPTQNGAPVSGGTTKSPLSDRNDAFTRLLLLDDITFPSLLLALGISFLWGAMHAMTPGHGKTIVGAYLVGSRGTIKHALYLGLATTITHTLGVFAFGLITLFAAHYILPETLYPWMSLLSGLFVVGIGVNLLVSRFRSSGAGSELRKLKASLAGSGKSYSPVLRHTHAEALSQPHRYVLNSSPASFHTHDHSTAHAHDHRGHSHEHGHEHNHADHSHLPPQEITWRSLLALGISGGVLPCPSALVVLLGAIALNKIGFGLILVLMFSLGLAGALTAIGIMFIYAGKLFQRFPASGKIIGFVPMLSALFVSLIGISIVIKALVEIGIV